MLLELRIGNLALAEDVVLRPGPGLTALTGETGAGKSLIAGALALVGGERGDRGLIRRGEDSAWVEAVCDLSDRPDLREEAARLGLRLGEDGLLVLRRELRREGRGRVLINGEQSSLAVLERLGGVLLAIQSQRQQQELRAAGYAREVLDTVLDLEAERTAAADALAAFQAAVAERTRRRQEHELAAQRLEIWRYQFDELERADLEPREEAALSEAIAIKRHAQDLQIGAATALAGLQDGPAPARETLGAAISVLGPHAPRSARLAAALQDLETAAELIAGAAGELDRFLDGFQEDPRDLDELEARKALYENLQRKHRCDVPGLLELRDQLADRLARQDQAESDLEQLDRACEAARDELARTCRSLHEARSNGAARVAAAAEELIRPLALGGLELAFTVEPQADPDGPIELAGIRCRVAVHGADSVRLLIRTNPGEAMGEVAAIASGGEAARIHLGLTVLGRGRQRPLVQLFDEVDAGLGMDAATPVAWLLCDLARQTQSICITHLPTVAVHARQHWLVTKQVRVGRTVVALTELCGDARVGEVARQLGGEGWRRGDAAAQLAYARELLASAGTG